MRNVSKSNFRATIAGIAVLGCAVSAITVAAPRAAFAQAPEVNADKPISINMQNTPIQAVLKALFNSVGANYSIDADVSGNVNITMNNVGFLAALRSILHATNPPLTYDYTDGVYHIRVKKQEPVVTTNNPNSSGNGDNGGGNENTGTPTQTASTDRRFYKLPVDHYDVIEMARFLANADMKTVEIVPASMGASGSGTTSATGLGGANAGGFGGMSGGMGMGGGMGMSGISTGGMGMGGGGFRGF